MGERRIDYIYGVNPVFEVVRSSRRRIFEAYINSTSSEKPRIKKLVNFLERSGIKISWVDKRRVLELSGSTENQGVVLRCSCYQYTPYADLLEHNPLMLLDNVEDPHNVGAILRSAEIFGFKSVALPMRGVPGIYPSVVKVSAGASEFLDIARESSANNYVKKAITAGYQIVALDSSGSVDMRELEFSPSDKFMLVIGGEDRSVGQFILNNSDYIVRIPQKGKINSLNASVAAAIAMFSLNS